jgi:hypothetical protein
VGTSKSLPTPSGGAWTPVKNAVTSALSDPKPDSPMQVAGLVVAATRGLRGASSGGGGGGGGAGGGVRGTGGGRGSGGGGGFRSSAARATSTLGGFGGLVGDAGLDAALEALGLAELQGRPAVEVVARISDRIAEAAEGLDAELLRGALIECVYEAAEISGDSSYTDLQSALQSFLEREGTARLAEMFLTRVTFGKIWMLIENHANYRSETVANADGLMVGVERACAQHVRGRFDEERARGGFDRLDWFGRDGQRVVNAIVRDVAARLEAASEGEGE